MFFRKKGKYTEVEGYDRISRLIQDRQRELSPGSTEEDDFDEESVLLTREPAPRERGARPGDERSATPQSRAQSQLPEERAAPAAAPRQASSAASGGEERRIHFQPSQPEPVSSSAETQQVTILPEEPTQIIQPPQMTVPDMGGPAVQGSLVAAEAVWEGKLLTDGNLRVEGTVHGEVQTGGTLFVAANAHIDGTIQARSILLGGEIEGQIRCGERLEILPGGSARGEIETGALVVHEGAFIDSRFQMRQTGTPARR